MEQRTAKVCIIGSGPGGLSTSMFLSKLKIPHLLIDKSVFPRDKVCGENMDGRVFHVLKRYDPQLIDELKSKNLIEETRNFSINLPKGKVPIAFDPKGTARLLAKRIDFDYYLFEKVTSSPYCEVLQGHVISDYRYDGEQIVFEGRDIEITADIGVVAVGFQSSLLKNRKDEKDLYFFNRMYFKNTQKFELNTVQTYYFESPVKCCLLIVPLPNNEFNVDIGISKSDYKRLKIRLEDLFSLLVNQVEELKAWFERAELVDKNRGVHLPITSTYKYFSDRNLLYVGASSFCVNPITGMGIGNAMIMGEMAAYEIEKYIQADSFKALDTMSYEKLAKKKLKNVFLLNGIINFFFRNLNITTPILLFIIRSRFVGRLLSQTTLLRNLRNPSFYFKRLFSKA